MRLYRADADVSAVRSFIDLIACILSVEDILCRFGRYALDEIIVCQNRQPRNRSVEHRRINILTDAVLLYAHERNENTYGRIQCAAADISDLNAGDGRCLSLAGCKAEDTCVAYIIKVMPRGQAIRAGLAVA